MNRRTDRLAAWAGAAVAVLLLWAAYAAGLLGYLLTEPGEVLRLLGQHVVLVLTSGATAVTLGLGLGIAISRAPLRRLAYPVIAGVSLGQTVPSLALLALIFALVRTIGFFPAYLALTLVTLLPIVRNTYQGLRGVDRDILEAGRGMGMSARQILWRLELPNALGTIFAGIRTALVINVGSAALAFLIGGGGLGDLIFSGIDTRRNDILIAGALPTVILALAVDWLLGRLERVVVSRGIRADG